MFPYGDPTGRGFLEEAGALNAYRILLHGAYRQFGRTPGSGFTVPEAFQEVADRSQIRSTVVSWLAFPKSVQNTGLEIDNTRFRLQDEYVEWRTERDVAGRVTRVTFTTEFAEYYEALAAAGTDPVIEEIRRVTGANSVSAAEVFGAGFDPARVTSEGRAARFLQRARQNPWNSTRSILFLSHPSSTLGALFNLAASCAVPTRTGAPSDMCAAVEGACVPTRNSDPAICTAVQDLARNGNSFTFVDPVGVVILGLQGIWKVNARQIDINASDLWTIERNGRRATLNVPANLTIVDNPIESGTEVAARLSVGAAVQFAPDAVLPEWSRMGQETSRQFPA
jgi:hypothetical protein